MSDGDQNMALDDNTKAYVASLVKESIGNTTKAVHELAGTVAQLAHQVGFLYSSRQTSPISDIAMAAAMSMINGKSPGDVNPEAVAEKAYEIALQMHTRARTLMAKEQSEANKKGGGKANAPKGPKTVTGKTFRTNSKGELVETEGGNGKIPPSPQKGAKNG